MSSGLIKNKDQNISHNLTKFNNEVKKVTYLSFFDAVVSFESLCDKKDSLNDRSLFKDKLFDDLDLEFKRIMREEFVN